MGGDRGGEMDGEMRARGARKGRHNGGDFDAARNMLGKVADAHSLQAEDGGGGAEGVLSLLRSAIELFPDCERSSLALSMCDSVKTDNCGGATMSSLVSAAARASQDASGPLDDLCLAVFWSGKRDQALIYAECAVAIDPSSAPMLSTFACMLMRTGRTVEADDALAKILELHGSNVSVICDAAAAVLDADMERAIRMYEHALELDPSFPQALFQYAAIVLEEEPPVEKHLAKLRLYGTQAHRMDPSCIDTMMALGKLEQRGGGKKDAQLAFHRVLEMSPSHPAALYSLAQCEEKWGTLESTAEAYAQAMAACPSSIQVLSSHARWIELQALRSDSPDVKGRAHLVERAISVYTKILTIDPHDYNALFHLGIMHKSQQDGIRAAIGFFKQAIGADPSKASALSHLGALRIARDTGNAFNQTDVGHFISAMTKSERACWLTRCQMSATMLERALSIDPMDLVALSTLGWYHAYVKRDGKAAAPLISRAIQIAPRDPHLLTWYARAMTLMKEFAVAKEALDRASIIMMMNGGLTRDEAEEELEGQLQRKEDSDVTLRDSRLAGAKILDEEMFGKIDKRILNDEDWRTSIGTQGGTVFNVTSLRAKGLIKIETEEQARTLSLRVFAFVFVSVPVYLCLCVCAFVSVPLRLCCVCAIVHLFSVQGENALFESAWILPFLIPSHAFQERWFTNYISRHEGKIENYKPSRPSRKRLGGSHEGVLYISNQGVHDEHVDKLSRLFGPVPFAKKSKKVWLLENLFDVIGRMSVCFKLPN